MIDWSVLLIDLFDQEEEEDDYEEEETLHKKTKVVKKETGKETRVEAVVKIKGM